MAKTSKISKAESNKTLAWSTFAFTVCFALWTIFSIIGIRIKSELGLSDSEFGLLIGTPILTGSLSRLFLGIWADQYGGRIIYVITMLAASLATYLLTFAETYPQFLIAALGIGIAGGSFAVGIAYVSKFYAAKDQGTALGIFGAGNVGAAVTKFCAPFVMVAYGWESVAQIWASVMAVTAVLFFAFTEDEPDLQRRRDEKKKPLSVLEQLKPLKNLQVWRFSLYYFFVFGGFVALALWLPRYLMSVYDLSIEEAGMLAVMYTIPASIFRALGGWISDKYGARFVMYLTFAVSAICTFFLSYPSTTYIINGTEGPIEFAVNMSLPVFIILIFILGFFMSLGKAAVYKHIPVYYAGSVGSVGGIVGLVGGLGGFFLPIAFGVLKDLTHVSTTCFMLLFVVTSVSFIWMHFSIIQAERKNHPELKGPKDFPELENDYYKAISTKAAR